MAAAFVFTPSSIKPAVSFSAPVLVARHAMATRFEIVLHGLDAPRLRAAGEEALDEIDRVEAQLSLYRPGSEVARLNAEAHKRPMRVTPSLFHLLEQARGLTQESSGAFDITIAPLVRCWGFMGATGSMPKPEDVAAARANVGMPLVELDPDQLTVRFTREGMMLDFGAIGKGHAVDRAAELLREAGVECALIHGGTSTAYAMGRPPDGPWKIAITSPANDGETLAAVELCEESLSVSARWGRSFTAGGVTYGHVIDPRSGAPAEGALLSALVLPSATESDALSTALLTAPDFLEALARRRPTARCLVVRGTPDAFEIEQHQML
jgi:thiamine biosynthesis lipoprotein